MADNATNKILTLKQQLREAIQLTQQLAGQPVINEEELNKAIARTADLRDRVNDVNEQVGVLTGGSKFEIMSNNLGDIGGKIASLDFEGAAESAQRLVTLTKTITLKDAVKGVKDLGSTFLNLGKALITNPLFLIATAIGLAVAAVVKLLDKMGVLKKIGEAVGWVFEKIGEFIDGIVESTSQVIDFLFGTTLVLEQQAQKQAAIDNKQLENVKKKVTAKTEAFDREINELKASGKNTEEVERKKLNLIIKTAEVEFKLYQERFRNKAYLAGLDQEEIENQRKLYQESAKNLKDARSDLKVFNNTQQKEKEDAIKKDAESSKAAADKARAVAKQNAADRLAASRQIEDLFIANLQDGVEKEIAINNSKYGRLIEDTLKNEKLKESEKEAIIVQYEKQRDANITAISEKDKAKKEAEVKAEEERLKTSNDKLKAVYDEYYAYIDSLQTDQVAKAEQERLAALDTELEQLQSFLDQKIITQEEYDQKAKEAELLAQTDIVKINKDAQDAITLAKEEAAEKDRQAKIAAAQEDLALAKQGLDAVSNLSDVFFSNKLSKLEKGSKEEEKVARKQFQFNKALQLGGAIIDGSKAVLASLASAPIAIGPVPNPAGIASLAFVAASSVANIAKIASTQFASSGGAPSATATPTPSTPAPATTPAQPAFNLFGQGNNANTVGPGSQQAIQNNVNVQSTVSVTEINQKQNKVKVIEERSQL